MIDTLLDFAAYAAPLIVTIGFLCAVVAFVIILASCIRTEYRAARRDEADRAARAARIVEGTAAAAARPRGGCSEVLPLRRTAGR